MAISDAPSSRIWVGKSKYSSVPIALLSTPKSNLDAPLGDRYRPSANDTRDGKRSNFGQQKPLFFKISRNTLKISLISPIAACRKLKRQLFNKLVVQGKARRLTGWIDWFN